MGEECGNACSLIGGIQYSPVAMEYKTTRGWKIKMAGKARVKGFVLKREKREVVRFYR